MKRFTWFIAVLAIAAGCEATTSSPAQVAGDGSSAGDIASSDTVGADAAVADTAGQDAAVADTTPADTTAGDTVSDALLDAQSDAQGDAIGTPDTGEDALPDASKDIALDTGDTTDPFGCCNLGGNGCEPGTMCIAGKACLPPAKAGACWTDADCGGDKCVGGFVCPCNADCMGPDVQGVCGGSSDLCCGAPCGKGETCVGSVCKGGGLNTGECWSDLDCSAGTACKGANICPCGAMCLVADKPGTCEPAGSGCCAVAPGGCPADYKCYQDQLCVTTQLAKGECWDSSDCGGQACVGAFVCPCYAKCTKPTAPGQCQSGDPLCCNPGGCASDKVCVSDKKMCKVLAELQTGQCWTDGECAKGETCSGANVCPCGAMCLVADKAGTCKAKTCSTIPPGALGMCEMVVGWGFDGKSCVMMSGCGCAPYCSSIFADQAACQAACP